MLRAYHVAGLAEKAQLVFVGEGYLRQELEQYCREHKLKHVHLLGFINQNKLPQLYAIGHVFCLISKEPWGLVVNEACVCEKPILVSDQVGSHVDLVGEENGYVVPIDDHDTLVNVLQELFNRRADWEKMGHVSYQRAKGYNFGAMTDGIISALTRIQSGDTIRE